jgi:hypothetical protein
MLIPGNDDFFIIIPKTKLVHINQMYGDSLSLTRMKANPDFDLMKITK